MAARKKAQKENKTEGKASPKGGRAQKPDGIRFTEEQKQALQEIQEKFSTSQANLVRWAVDGLIAKWRNEGRIVLPFRFESEDDHEGKQGDKPAQGPPKGTDKRS